MAKRKITTIKSVDDPFDMFDQCTDEEDAILEASIKERGCVDPVEEWHGITADGRRRRRICEKVGKEYGIAVIDPNWSVEKVQQYLRWKQNARRHVGAKKRQIELAKMYFDLSQQAEVTGEPVSDEQAKITNVISGAGVRKQKAKKARKVVAEAAGVSEATVDRAVTKAELVNQLPEIIRGQHESGKCLLTNGQAEILLGHPQLGEVERALRVGQAECTSDAFESVTGKPLKAKVGRPPGSKATTPLARKLKGMMATIDRLRRGVDEMVSDDELLTRSEAKPLLDALDVPRKRLYAMVKEMEKAGR